MVIPYFMLPTSHNGYLWYLQYSSAQKRQLRSIIMAMKLAFSLATGVWQFIRVLGTFWYQLMEVSCCLYLPPPNIDSRK